MKKIKYILFIALIVIGCKEPFEIETQEFKSVLVVEATITNELKHQEVKLSRTSALESNEQILENNAIVNVIDDEQNIFSFAQSTEGSYVSDIPFQAEPNVTYTLEITTSNGRQYVSEPTLLTPVSQIDNLYAELIDGTDVKIFVDSNNSTTGARYFRYEYDETYKVVAPKYTNRDIEITNYDLNTDTYDIIVSDNLDQEEVCFQTKNNLEIIQTTTSELEDNDVLRLPVKKISSSNGVLRDRYSILVKQYIQNIESYTYYKTINELGSIGSLLSENQTGFVLGNVSSTTSTEEKVIGFFEISSYSEKRIYFNYSDFNIPQPSYLYECNVYTLDYNDNTTLDDDGNDRQALFNLVTVFDYKLVTDNNTNNLFTIVNQECGDCTSVATNVQPDFWED